ncbi:MAG: mismatch-specific DNA-glycosylase, partial [Anaerolineales bacterium]|nr:mismatch-specific DNA-glycosylase [Anaerolineales bacterium]
MLHDLLTPNLALVICGTAAGHESAARQQYYAKPGNRFWPTLFDTGLTPVQLAPNRYRELLTYGIGLTDLAKGVQGMDHELDANAFDRTGL